MLLRVLRPITYLGSSLVAIAVLARNDQARKSARSNTIQDVPIPQNLQTTVNKLAEQMKLPNIRNIYVTCSRTLSDIEQPSQEDTQLDPVVLYSVSQCSSLPMVPQIPYGILCESNTLTVSSSSSQQPLDLIRLQTPVDPKQVHFTVCHELAHIKYQHSRKRGFYIPIGAITIFEIWFRFAQTRFKERRQKAVTALGALSLYGIGYVILSWFQELRADGAAAQVSRETCQGGLLSLSWHQRLSMLLKGEPISGISWSHPPVSLRKAFLQYELSKYDQKS
eukprot:gene9727-1930_t